jgi:hypothetical protein
MTQAPLPRFNSICNIIAKSFREQDERSPLHPEDVENCESWRRKKQQNGLSDSLHHQNSLEFLADLVGGCVVIFAL